MKNKFTKIISSVLLAIICSISLAMPIFADDERPCIVDDADLLTDSQEENLTAQAKEIIKKHKTDIVIVTTDGMRGKTPEQFADDFYDQNKYGVGANNAGVLVAVDMFNRKVAISCAGEAMEHIDDSRATEIRKSITPNLTSGNFEYAFEMFIDNVDSYYNQPKIKDFKYDAKTDSLVKVRSVSLVQILLFAGISILAGLLACFGVKAKYQLKFPTYNYPIDERTTVNMRSRHDLFIREHTSSYRVESSSSSNGSSGGSHSSSSGSGHSGSSGSF